MQILSEPSQSSSTLQLNSPTATTASMDSTEHVNMSCGRNIGVDRPELKDSVMSCGDKSSTGMDLSAEQDNNPCEHDFLTLASFGNPRVFVGLFSVLAFFMFFVLSGLVPSSILPWIDDFHISNEQGGFVHSVYDIVSCIVALPYGYMAAKLHLPRAVSGGMFLFGIGTILMGLSKHFYPEPTPSAYWVLALGQTFNGLGGMLLSVYVPTFMSKNISPIRLPMYATIIQITFSLGPAIGFVVAGALIKSWTWFNGFILTGAVMALCSLSLIPIPKTAPRNLEDEKAEEMKLRLQHKSMTQDEDHAAESELPMLKDLPKLLLSTVKNPKFCFLVLIAIATDYLIASVVTFLPAFISYAYGVSASRAATLMGISIIPGAILGGATGGLIDRFWAVGITRRKAILMFVGDCCTVSFLWLFWINSFSGFVITLAIAIFFKFILITPLITCVLRVLKKSELGIGLAFFNILRRACGGIPGPIITGSLFDSSCITNDSPCTTYDISKLRWVVAGSIGMCCALVILSSFSMVMVDIITNGWNPKPKIVEVAVEEGNSIEMKETSSNDTASNQDEEEEEKCVDFNSNEDAENKASNQSHSHAKDIEHEALKDDVEQNLKEDQDGGNLEKNVDDSEELSLPVFQPATDEVLSPSEVSIISDNVHHQ